jgi:hypothetical protein
VAHHLNRSAASSVRHFHDEHLADEFPAGFIGKTSPGERNLLARREYMNVRFIFLVIMAALSLAACTTGPQVGERQNLFRALPGSEFILHKGIVIPPGRLRVSFQGGKLSYGASEFEPRCELELRHFSEEPQTIHPGTYRIDSVRGQDRYTLHPDEKILLAAADVLQLASDGGDSQWYMNTYRMKLQSDVHADAPTLICGGAYNFAFYIRYPDLQEMQAALGDYAQLKLR